MAAQTLTARYLDLCAPQGMGGDTHHQSQESQPSHSSKLPLFQTILFYGHQTSALNYYASEVKGLYKQEFCMPFEVQTVEEVLANPQKLQGQRDLFQPQSTAQGFLIFGVSETHFTKLSPYLTKPGLVFLLVAPTIKSTSKWIKGVRDLPQSALWSVYDLNDGHKMQAFSRAFEASGGSKRQLPQGLGPYLSEDLMRVAQEAKKLALFLSTSEEQEAKRAIDLEGALDLLSSRASSTLSKFCQHVALKKAQEALRSFQDLKLETLEDMAILRALSLYMRRLLMVKGHLREKKPFEVAIKLLRPPLFFKEVPVFRQALTLWASSEILNFLALLLMSEKTAKISGSTGSDPESPWLMPLLGALDQSS